jgi:hypothetical protein
VRVMVVSEAIKAEINEHARQFSRTDDGLLYHLDSQSSRTKSLNFCVNLLNFCITRDYQVSVYKTTVSNCCVTR